MNAAVPHPQIKVAILAFDGCMASAVAGLLDTLEIANLWTADKAAGRPGRFRVQVYAPGADSVRGSGGMIIPCTPLHDTLAPDVAIVPPIMASVVETLEANLPITAWLQRSAERCGIVASVCAGAFFLAEAGLLAGRRATTNPAYAELFRQRYRNVELLPDERIIDQGNILCAGSTTAFLTLAIHLINRFAGHEAAVLTAKTLCVDKNHGSQLPYSIYVAPKDHGDEVVHRLQSWIEDNYGEPVSAADLARRGAMSPRSLHRRFSLATGLSPVDYLHKVRVEVAKRLLETTDLMFEDITARVGYRDSRAFHRLFKSVSGLSPREYRNRFGMGLGMSCAA